MCVLRVYGATFDPEAYLAADSGLKALHVYVPGDPMFDRRRARREGTEPGFDVGVSNRPWSDWDGQIQDAIRFLHAHAKELRALRDAPEVTTLCLDVPTEVDPDSRHVTVWEGGFPAELLAVAARAGVDLHATVYFATPEAEERGEGTR